MAERFGKNQKPLFVIDGPVKTKAYRSNFKPFEALRFLDLKKLKKVKAQWLELGTIEAVGRSATLVGKIEKGELTRVTLQGCVGCQQKGKKRRRRIDEKVFLAIRDRLDDVRAGKIKLRQRLPSARRLSSAITIPIWPFPPIVIIISPGDDFCVAVNIPGHVICYMCIGDMVWGNCIFNR
jgi:hypothetical protein